MKILAALDGSAVSDTVAGVAEQAASAIGGHVEAVTVGSSAAAAEVADRHGLALRQLAGGVPDALCAAAAAEDVVLLVAGARGRRSGRHPAGSVTQALMTSSRTPLLVVPPHLQAARPLRRILIALDGTAAAADALAPVTVMAMRRGLDVVAVHVLDPASAPPFVDQPHHWAEAFQREFGARHAPGVDQPVELRAGEAAPCLTDAATQLGADVVALGWHQVLDPGRAAVVRSAVDHGNVPVLLLPIPAVAAHALAGSSEETQDRGSP